jgi:hypothetical protein
MHGKNKKTGDRRQETGDRRQEDNMREAAKSFQDLYSMAKSTSSCIRRVSI